MSLLMRRLKENDFAVIDGERNVGRLYCERLPEGVRWRWFLQAFDVVPVGIRASGHADTLAEAKAEFLAEYRKIVPEARP